MVQLILLRLRYQCNRYKRSECSVKFSNTSSTNSNRRFLSRRCCFLHISIWRYWLYCRRNPRFNCGCRDQSSGIRWNNGSNVTTGATETAVGTGAANTTTIISAQGATETSYAAGLARAYTGGGYTDWFLPSKDELNRMYTNRATINTTAAANSGSDFVSITTGVLRSTIAVTRGSQISTMDQYYANKDVTNNVRAVRAF